MFDRYSSDLHGRLQRGRAARDGRHRAAHGAAVCGDRLRGDADQASLRRLQPLRYIDRLVEFRPWLDALKKGTAPRYISENRANTKESQLGAN